MLTKIDYTGAFVYV